MPDFNVVEKHQIRLFRSSPVKVQVGEYLMYLCECNLGPTYVTRESYNVNNSTDNVRPFCTSYIMSLRI